MRQVPTDVPSLENREAKGQITQVRHYRLITPLFGGGVQPGVVDEKFPVRGATVRGQLRFWWRATRGGDHGPTRAAMKAAEDRIWGSTTGGSKVTVAVVNAKAGQPFQSVDRNGQPTEVGNIRSVDSYAAFPLRGKKAQGGNGWEKEPGVVHERVTFDLRLSFPTDLAKEVQAALWAWETFGGVGARTRRGFGAVHCTRVDTIAGDAPGPWQWAYERDDLAGQLEADYKHLVSDQPFPDGVPHLSRDPRRYRVVTAGPGHDAVAVWRMLIGKLSAFRQSRPPARPPAKKTPGRSYWPEPDAIRRLTRTPNPLPPERRAHYAFNKFPRAAFGLPIIFEFKNEKNANFYEPRQTELKGGDASRMASPLILRPLPLAGGGFAGLALILDAPGPDDVPGGLALKGAPGNPVVTAQLNPGEATAIEANHPSYNGDTDVLQAFLDQL